MQSLIQFPDHVFGLGKAGRELTCALMEQEWFLEEAMRPRDDPTNAELNAYIVDTALEEEGEAKRRVRGAREKIDDIYNNDPDVNKPHIEYVNPTVGGGEYVNHRGLTIQSTVSDIVERNGLDHWWIDSNNEDHIEADYDFDTGVVRRRALSKAVFYGAKTGGEVIDEWSNADGQIAIVTALGGGTGSGMFIDLARYLDDDGVDVNLFAVLPHEKEPAKPHSNAFAALSELEFLEITGQSPFENVVLLPFDPVRDSSQDAKNAFVDEFDEAFASTLLSFYNIEGDTRKRFSEETPTYAPFTVAVPRVIRYNTQAVAELENDVEAFTAQRKDVQRLEADLYDKLRDDLLVAISDRVSDAIERGGPQYMEEDEVRLDPDEKARLNIRINELEDLVTMEVFDQLDYDSIDEFRDMVEAARTENPVEMIRNLEQERETRKALDELASGGREDIEFAEMLETELDLLHERMELLQYNQLVDDEVISRNTVDYLIGNYDQHEDITGLDTVIDRHDSVKRQTFSLEDEIEELEEELEETSNALKGLVSNWLGIASENVSQLERLNDAEPELIDAASVLDEELRRAASRIKGADTPEEYESATFDSDIDDLLDDLEAVGIDSPAFDDADPNEALSYLKQARDQTFESDGNVLDSITKTIFGRQDDERALQVYKRVREELDLQSPQLVSVPDWNQASSRFDIDIEYEFEEAVEEAIEERRNELVGSVVDSLSEAGREAPSAVTGAVGETLPEVRSIVQSAAEDGENLETQLKRRVEGALRESLVDDLEADIQELHEEKSALESRLERLEQARAVYTWQNDQPGGVYVDEAKQANEALEALQDRDIDEPDGDFKYIYETAHPNIADALQQEDIADSNLWEGDSEKSQRGRLKSHLKSFINDDICGSSEYLNLNAKHIQGGEEQMGYAGHRAALVYMSRAFDANTLDDFAGEKFPANDSPFYFSGSDSYHMDVIDNGGAWDLNLTFFLSGVFLDNLSNVSHRRNGYRPRYENREQKRGQDIMLHHAHGLGGEDDSEFATDGDGLYVRRGDLLNVDIESDAQLLSEASSSEVVETLLEEYYDPQTFVSDNPFNRSRADQD